MKHSIILIILFVIMNLFVITSCGETYYNSLNGTVLDESNDSPLEKVEISYQSINGASKIKNVFTNINGTFEIKQEVGETSNGVILTITKDRYQKVIISSEYKDWYKTQNNPRSTSLKHDFGIIKLKAME